MTKRPADAQLGRPAKRPRSKPTVEEIKLGAVLSANLVQYVLSSYVSVHWLDIKARAYVDDRISDQQRFGKPYLGRDGLIDADIVYWIVHDMLWVNACTADEMAERMDRHYLTGELIKHWQWLMCAGNGHARTNMCQDARRWLTEVWRNKQLD